MYTPKVFFVAGPNYRNIQAVRESGLVIDTSAVSRKIGNNKSRLSDRSDNSVADLVVVLDLVDSDCFQSESPDRR